MEYVEYAHHNLDYPSPHSGWDGKTNKCDLCGRNLTHKHLVRMSDEFKVIGKDCMLTRLRKICGFSTKQTVTVRHASNPESVEMEATLGNFEVKLFMFVPQSFREQVIARGEVSCELAASSIKWKRGSVGFVESGQLKMSQDSVTKWIAETTKTNIITTTGVVYDRKDTVHWRVGDTLDGQRVSWIGYCKHDTEKATKRVKLGNDFMDYAKLPAKKISPIKPPYTRDSYGAAQWLIKTMSFGLTKNDATGLFTGGISSAQAQWLYDYWKEETDEGSTRFRKYYMVGTKMTHRSNGMYIDANGELTKD